MGGQCIRGDVVRGDAHGECGTWGGDGAWGPCIWGDGAHGGAHDKYGALKYMGDVSHGGMCALGMMHIGDNAQWGVVYGGNFTLTTRVRFH